MGIGERFKKVRLCLGLSQPEMSERLSAEKLWTLGRVFDVDPLLMYVISRGIDPRYLSSASRDRLFS